MNRRAVWVALLAISISLLSAAVIAYQNKDAPVPKYGVIWEGKLTRSGLPKDESGWKWLRSHGINTVVNFRQDNDVDYKKFGFRAFSGCRSKATIRPQRQMLKSFSSSSRTPITGRFISIALKENRGQG